MATQHPSFNLKNYLSGVLSVNERFLMGVNQSWGGVTEKDIENVVAELSASQWKITLRHLTSFKHRNMIRRFKKVSWN